MNNRQMKEATMNINNVSHSIDAYNTSPLNQDSKVAELNDLWDEWYNNPSKETAEKLLNFLKENKSYFENLTKGKPVPYGFPADSKFDNVYNAAITSLSGWIDHGCNPGQKTPVSGFIANVNTWVSE